MEPITIQRIQLTYGKLSIQVATRHDARYTNKHLVECVLADFPNLPLHSCVNQKGPRFEYVMADTSIPHLLEHLIIDQQVAEEDLNSQVTFTGHTEWLNEDACVAAVTVNFQSDACALRAVAYACSYLNELLRKAPNND